MNRSNSTSFAVVVVGTLAIVVASVESADPAPASPRATAAPSASKITAALSASKVTVPVSKVALPPSNKVENVTEPDGEVAEVKEQALRTYYKFQVRYAEVFLELTKLDLQKINEINARMPNLYSDAEVQRMRLAVDTAEERLKAAKQMANGEESNSMIGSAQAALKSAEAAYGRAIDVNRRLPGTVGPVDLERLKMSIELAKVSMAQAKALGLGPPPLLVLQWQMDELREEVRQMRWRLTAITSRR